MNEKRKYDSTVARIAGNLMAGYVEVDEERRAQAVQRAVAQARAILWLKRNAPNRARAEAPQS